MKHIQPWAWHAHHHLSVAESNWRLDIYTPLQIYLLLKRLHSSAPFKLWAERC